jgi:hypothetical protein
MEQTERLLTTEERAILETLAKGTDLEAQRARALLALDAGQTQTIVAEQTGMTLGQVRYSVQKFRAQKLGAFSTVSHPAPGAAEAAAPAEETDPEQQARINTLLTELDELVTELRETMPESLRAPYSPLNMLTLVRERLHKIGPAAQLEILEQFEGMTRDDLLDIETWKGIAYMIGYSAQFQASQTREKLNEQLPDPLKPDTILHFLRENLERMTPEAAKQVVSIFEGATREDLLDPDTWKGMLTMLGYSAQFQAQQTRERLNQELPEPFKPDTLLGFFKSGLERFTPEVARQIASTFEGATHEDLLDADTWKGVWYMLNYSLQFQAEQWRRRLTGEETADTGTTAS